MVDCVGSQPWAERVRPTKYSFVPAGFTAMSVATTPAGAPVIVTAVSWRDTPSTRRMRALSTSVMYTSPAVDADMRVIVPNFTLAAVADTAREPPAPVAPSGGPAKISDVMGVVPPFLELT